MASRNAALAEAVKSALNTAAAASTFKFAFTAKRVYVPLFDEAALNTLAVTVFSGPETGDRETREDVNPREMTVQIGIQKRMKGADPSLEAANVELDGLTEFVEQIADWLGPDTVAQPVGLFIAADIPVAGAPEHLKQSKVYTGLVIATFLKQSN